MFREKDFKDAMVPVEEQVCITPQDRDMGGMVDIILETRQMVMDLLMAQQQRQ